MRRGTNEISTNSTVSRDSTAFSIHIKAPLNGANCNAKSVLRFLHLRSHLQDKSKLHNIEDDTAQNNPYTMNKK